MQEGQFEVLVDKCLAGDATPEDMEVVILAARQSEDLERVALDRATMEAALRTLHHDPAAFAKAVAGRISRQGRTLKPAGRARAKAKGGMPVPKRPVRKGDGPAATSKPGPPVRRRSRLDHLHEPPPRSFPLFQYVLLPVAACVLALLGIRWMWREFGQMDRCTGMARVNTVRSDSTCLRDGKRAVMQQGMDLQSGDTLSVPVGGSVTLTYAADPTRVTLGGDTTAELREDKGERRIHIERGVLEADVAPRSAALAMTVTTPHVSAAVQSTRFRIVVETQRTQVQVDEGVLRLKRQDNPSDAADLGAGYVAVATPGAPLSWHRIGAAESARAGPKRSKSVLDFERAADGKWLKSATAGSLIRFRVATPGQASPSALRVDYFLDGRQTEFPWVWVATRTEVFGQQDWSSYDGLEFWFYGNATGVPITFEIQDNDNPARPGDTAERFVFTFPDDTQGWRLLSVPWHLFIRRREWQPEGAPDDGFTLKRVGGLSFILDNRESRGWFMVDGVRLVGK
ncbi:MAG: FecR domain-containing protein [Kiritimatiellae bacterium]|nr:FecR domain-containing protein [Kiritimatiellia bacterium]